MSDQEPRHSPDGGSIIPKGRGGRLVATAIVLILLIIFVFRNAQPVRLDFIVVSGHPRLIWLIVGCVLVGAAIGYTLGRPARPRRHPSGNDPDLGPGTGR